MKIVYSFIKTLRHETVIHFFVLALILFSFYYYWSWNKKEKLIIDKQTINYLVKKREELLLRSMTEEEYQQLINEYLEDELLYREAYKRGLNNNNRKRRNFVAKMKSMAYKNIRKPTSDELKVFFDRNQDNYVFPANISWH